MCIRQSLLDTIFRILLSRFLVSFTNRLAYSGMKIKFILCLMVFRKSIKTHVASLELLTNIYDSTVRAIVIFSLGQVKKMHKYSYGHLLVPGKVSNYAISTSPL